MSLGAAIAFYTIFSLAPILIIVIFVAGLVFGEETARAELMSQISEFAGEDAAGAVEGVLEEASRPGSGIIAMAFSLVVLVVGATTVFTELRSALNRIWQVPDPPEGGIWAMLWSRAIAFVLVLAVAALLLGLVAVSAVLSALGDVWSAYIGGWNIALRLLDLLVSFAILTIDVRPDLPVCPARRHRLERRVARRGGDGRPVHHRPLSDRPLSRHRRRRIGLRGRGLAGRAAHVGLLLRADLPAGGGVHLGLCPPPRLAGDGLASGQGQAPPEPLQPLTGGMKLVGVVAAIGFVIGMITRR
jgi:hypothetical protein